MLSKQLHMLFISTTILSVVDLQFRPCKQWTNAENQRWIDFSENQRWIDFSLSGKPSKQFKVERNWENGLSVDKSNQGATKTAAKSSRRSLNT